MMPLSLVKSNLSSPSKLLYSILLYLCQSDTGNYYCCPSNEWLAAQLCCCENSITKYLKELRDNHYVMVQDSKVLKDDGCIITRRVISLTKLSAEDMHQMEQAYKMFHVEVYDKEKESWTDTDLGIEEEGTDITKDVIDYLNKRAGTRYRVGKTVTRSVNAIVTKGYTLNDFKQVIDNKCADWLYSDMEKYLRPETLFGNKFDTYLNQKIAVTQQQLDRRKIEQLQKNNINPYQYTVPVNDVLYDTAQSISDEWFNRRC